MMFYLPYTNFQPSSGMHAVSHLIATPGGIYLEIKLADRESDHSVYRIGMSGVVPPLPFDAFMAYTGKGPEAP
jgi:hypothetical protein